MAKYREIAELGAFLRRMAKALVRRAADGDLEAVEVLAKLNVEIAQATREAGDAAFRCNYSYRQIGDALGISRQAARQRFAPKDEEGGGA